MMAQASSWSFEVARMASRVGETARSSPNGSILMERCVMSLGLGTPPVRFRLSLRQQKKEGWQSARVPSGRRSRRSTFLSGAGPCRR